MAQVIGVRFNNGKKIYYFDPLGYEITLGEGVIVETTKGLEYATLVIEKKEVPDDIVVQPLKPVIRKATKDDEKRLEDNKVNEKKAYDICRDCITKHKLDMKLINIEYAFDSNKIVFFFTADGRVDFRELVKDLASIFKTRIELRQIGVRDEAKMLGGLGPCGRPACCAEFLSDFQPVSIKMAKEQNLSLSPTKISGLCGRLMCCLNYEQELYEKAKKKLPRVDKEVTTPDGNGIVIEVAPLTEIIKVKVQLADGSFDVREYPAEEVQLAHGPKKHGNCAACPKHKNVAEAGAQGETKKDAQTKPQHKPEGTEQNRQNKEQKQDRDSRQNKNQGGKENSQKDRKQGQEKRNKKPYKPAANNKNKEVRPQGDRQRPNNAQKSQHTGKDKRQKPAPKPDAE